MANYTILVHNKSGDDHEYVLFNEMPKPGPTPGKGVFQNAYITSKMVTNDTGTGNFQIQLVINAVTGTRSERTNTGINDVIKVHDELNDIAANGQGTITNAVHSGSGKAKPKAAISDQVSAQICQTTNGEISPGSAVHVSIVEGKPKFVTQEPKQTCAVDGSFSISVDGSFEFPSTGKFWYPSRCASCWLGSPLELGGSPLSAIDVSMVLQIIYMSASVVATLMITQMPTHLSLLSLRNLTPPISLHPSPGTMSPGEVVQSVKGPPLRQWALPRSLNSTGKALATQMLFTTRMVLGPYRTFEGHERSSTDFR